MVDCKGIGHIVVAFIAALECLLVGMANTSDVGGIHGTTNDIADTSSDIFRLIITTFAQALRMKWHRDDNVDFIEEIRLQKGQRNLSAELVTDKRLVGKLHPVDHILHRMLFLKEQIGCGSPQVHSLHSSHKVRWLTCNSHFCTIMQQHVLLGQRQ